jgi:alpha-1,2-mannosyltransferase
VSIVLLFFLGYPAEVRVDSMGYAFTYPFVRFVAGGDIGIGAYVHYPTVSSDMVRRVRERSEGVENAGASKSWSKTQVKLM